MKKHLTIKSMCDTLYIYSNQGGSNMIDKENLGYSDALLGKEKRYPNNIDYLIGYVEGLKENKKS